MNYKKIVYVDNDNETMAQEDVHYVKDMLEYWGNMEEKEVDKLEITTVSGFNNQDPDKMYEIIFSGEVVIATWSMYTAVHYNSLGQLQKFLRIAATSDVKNIVYLDSSGEIEKALQRILRDENKFAMHILQAIETNYIITTDYKEIYRLRVDLKGFWEPIFKREKIDISKLLSTDIVTKGIKTKRVRK